MQETNLILYGTQGCHLCDEAEQLIKDAGWSYQYVDIIDDNDLMERFAIRIPVVAIQGFTEETQLLGWPFDQHMLAQWLTHIR